MASLYNYTELRLIEPEDTFLLDVTRKSNATVNFKIAVRNKSKDTLVYHTFAFNYLSNATGTPQTMVYKGKNFLIHNTSSNCLKGIDPPIDRGVQEECSKKDFKDPNLKRWSKATHDDESSNEPKIKRAALYNYVSCHEYNITIENSEHSCPDYPFRIPLTTSFHTFGHNHTAIELTRSWGGPQWKMIDTSLPSQLMPEQSDEHTQLIKSLDKLREMEKELASISSHPLNSKSNMYLASFIVGLLIILALITVIKALRQAYNEFIIPLSQKQSTYDKIRVDTDKIRDKGDPNEIKKLYDQRYPDDGSPTSPKSIITTEI